MRNMVASCVAIGVAIMLAAPSLPGAQQSRSADSRRFKPEERNRSSRHRRNTPDPLLAQIFMASTYPLEVIQAGFSS
jgi:hypothetical protein